MDPQTPQTPPESRPVPGELLRLLRQFPASGEIESPSRQLFWAGCIDEGLVEELNGILGFAYRLTQKGNQFLEEERHTSDAKQAMIGNEPNAG
jgi:hypothetical protein